jgi:ankyrin repeat protein
MLYSLWQASLSTEQMHQSLALFKNAQSSKLGEMRNILRDDNVGIADYRRGHSEKPIATTLTEYLEACKKRKKDALPGTQLLVQHGANASIELSNGDSAMSMAVKFDMVNVARYLIEIGGEIKVYLFRSVEMMKLFTEKGFEIRSHTPDGFTLLQNVRGVSTKASDLRHFIVAHGCDIDELSKAGDTALHLSISSGDTACVTDLCHMGASLDIRNGEGKTPMELAIHLCDMGGGLDEINRQGKTGWQLARHLADIENKKILEEEPMRRKTIDYIYAVLSDMEFIRESRVVDPKIADSELQNLGPDPHKSILKHLGIFRT